MAVVGDLTGVWKYRPATGTSSEARYFTSNLTNWPHSSNNFGKSYNDSKYTTLGIIALATDPINDNYLYALEGDFTGQGHPGNISNSAVRDFGRIRRFNKHTYTTEVYAGLSTGLNTTYFDYGQTPE